MRLMKRKIMDWYEEHEEGINAIGTVTGAIISTYSVATLFMMLWKKLGFYNHD